MKRTVLKILFASGIVVFAAACNQQPPAVQTSPQVPQRYTNSSYDFSFTYGNDVTFVTPTYGNLSNQVVQVNIGNEAYPKTNFDDAAFTVSEAYAKTQADCLALPSTAVDKNPFTTTQSINGVTFYTSKGSDAGAGNLYASTIYRTYHDTDCIELTETIHTSQIGNYPAGTVTAIDVAPIQAELDTILNSFTFTK
jgi:hypothetical protein